MLTWEEICKFDEAALNTAIDTHVFGYTWHPVQYGHEEQEYWWQCTDDPGVLVTKSSVPYFHHTADWNRTMALATRYKIGVRYDLFDGYGRVGWLIECAETMLFIEDDRDNGIPCPVEHDVLVALCRVALWEALCLEEAIQQEGT